MNGQVGHGPPRLEAVCGEDGKEHRMGEDPEQQRLPDPYQLGFLRERKAGGENRTGRGNEGGGPLKSPVKCQEPESNDESVDPPKLIE